MLKVWVGPVRKVDTFQSIFKTFRNIFFWTHQEICSLTLEFPLPPGASASSSSPSKMAVIGAEMRLQRAAKRWEVEQGGVRERGRTWDEVKTKKGYIEVEVRRRWLCIKSCLLKPNIMDRVQGDVEGSGTSRLWWMGLRVFSAAQEGFPGFNWFSVGRGGDVWKSAAGSGAWTTRRRSTAEIREDGSTRLPFLKRSALKRSLLLWLMIGAVRARWDGGSVVVSGGEEEEEEETLCFSSPRSLLPSILRFDLQKWDKKNS